jgi:hypothetical protein
MFILGKSFSASSPLTDGWTMTSSPVDCVSFYSTQNFVLQNYSPGTQLIGVVMRCLSPVWRESTMRRTSAVLRPVLAG